MKKKKDFKEYALTKIACLIRDKYTCVICRVRQNLHIHHVIFRSHGGKDTLDNLATLCVDCHTSVHKGNPRLYYDERQNKIFYCITGIWKPRFKVR